jgi:hypothetical protein
MIFNSLQLYKINDSNIVSIFITNSISTIIACYDTLKICECEIG